MYWRVWEVAVNCIEIAAWFYLLKRRLGLLPHQHWRGWLGYILIVLTITALNSYGVDVAITLICVSVMLLFWALFAFDGSPTNRMLWFLGCAVVPYITNGTLDILFALTGFDLQASLNPSLARFIAQLLYLAVTVTICAILTLFPKEKGQHLPGMMRMLLLGIMTANLLCLAANAQIFEDANLSSKSAKGFVLNDLALFGTGIAIFLLFEHLGAVTQQRLDLSERLAQHAARKEEQERAEAAARTWRHDMRRALEPIAFYLSRGDTEHVQKYFADLHITVDALGAGVDTGSFGLDAELSTRKAQARLMNIHMQIMAQKLDFTGINEAQLGIAAANLLDNAIEACQRVERMEDRFIEVRLYTRGDMIVFEVLNSADGEYRRTGQGMVSTKQDGDHGHGYDQLQILVDACGGYYMTEPRNDSFRVLVCLPKGKGSVAC